MALFLNNNMRLLYNMAIALFDIAIKIAAPFNVRASLISKGRKAVWRQLSDASLQGNIVWIHCASLGEFEQGRPLIEAIREAQPDYKILLSFFSPSGYEVRKNYSYADVVCYLPSDTKRNARRFIKMANPKLVFFVKYEYWYHYFKELKREGIALYSVSSIFRDEQIFFKWYGAWFRKILSCVRLFYLQDEKSAGLLKSIGLNNYVVAGDTRFDRVRAIAAAAAALPDLEDFAKGASVMVAGSSWPADEAILSDFVNSAAKDVKLIIAPHEVHEAHLAQLEERFRVPVYRYSKQKGNIASDARVLIIDTIGLLSSIYRYGSVAYIGGGFGKGIHNTLEAATYGMPVIFGPNHLKFKEALDLKELGAGFSISDKKDFLAVINKLWNQEDDKALKAAGMAAREYVESKCGATEQILKEIGAR